jgi:hypothetical protein
MLCVIFFNAMIIFLIELPKREEAVYHSVYTFYVNCSVITLQILFPHERKHRYSKNVNLI